jgi:hypothetical protein
MNRETFIKKPAEMEYIRIGTFGIAGNQWTDLTSSDVPFVATDRDRKVGEIRR